MALTPAPGPGAAPQAAAARRLPAVDQVLAWPALAASRAAFGRTPLLAAVRAELAACRAAGLLPDDATLQAAIQARVAAAAQPHLRPVFNLTGTVLHTNLGRAPLPAQALTAISAVAGGACNLEYDLAAGARGDRDDAVEGLLCQLTGAEAATVVNNTAAALVLVLATLARQKEVIVSRGELIEIGGAFRLPDIMRAAGCRLREVGTTNRTHLQDHADAIGPRTALLLKVHTSNYRIEGFSAAADEAALAALGRAHGLPLVIDLGSGALIDLATLGLPHEPTPAEALAAGASLVLFSGDKLLGGPQAGLIVGSRPLIAKLKKSPLKRALRCDKLTLAALEAVLRLYADPDRLVAQLPTLRLLARPLAQIDALAQRLLPGVAAWLANRWVAALPAVQAGGQAAGTAGTAGPAGTAAAAAGGSVALLPVHSQIGSGALPVDRLPSVALRLAPPATLRGSGRWLDALARQLRALPIPVIGRIADGALLLDLRCLEDEAGFLAQLQLPTSTP